MRRTLLSELKACSSLRDLEWGKSLHQAAIRSGVAADFYVASTLVNMYAKCGSMRDARAVFDRIDNPNVVPWTALILGYADNGEPSLALHLFSRMHCAPNERTFVAAVKACTAIATKGGGSVSGGKELHLLASRSGFDSHLHLQSTLLDMYAKCGNMEDCCKVFEAMSSHDVVAWTALIWGHATYGKAFAALDAFARMRCDKCDPDSRAFVAALKACTSLAEDTGKHASEVLGKAVHLLASASGYDSDMYVQGTLVDMYANIERMEEARRIFVSMKRPDVVAWTALILGYAVNGEGDTALDLFSKMQCEPNYRTFVAALKACCDAAEKEEGSLKVESREIGKQIHMLAVKSACASHLHVECTLVDMYATCGSMEDARLVFESMQDHDIVSWTIIILGYAEQGEALVALDLFSRMRSEGCKPEGRSLLAALKACTKKRDENGSLDKDACGAEGKALHELASLHGHDADMYVQSALMDMYSQCGLMEDAQRVFDSMKHRDTTCWSILMLRYAENGKADVVLALFERMKREGYEPDGFTFAAVLKACGMLGALETGKAVHAEICSRSFQSDVVLANCLVDFYAKCGSLPEAERVFDSHATKDLEILNALMAGYGRHGDTERVFGLFERIRDSLQPNAVTFIVLLACCNHAGLVDKGREYFDAMRTKHGIHPEMEHYAGMIDMLGRSNKLDEAMQLLRTMPSGANLVIWMTVLGACRKWRYVELGSLAFQSVICFDNENSGAYVEMANLRSADKENRE